MKYEITCTYCGNNQYYKPRDKIPKKPHTKCSKCKKEFNFKIDTTKEIIIENQSKIPKKNKSHNISPQPSSINDSLIEMDDTPLIRHTCRIVLVDNYATHRERLEACDKLMKLKEKLGTLNLQTQSEKEVVEKFRQQPTQILVELLKKSSQEELS